MKDGALLESVAEDVAGQFTLLEKETWFRSKVWNVSHVLYIAGEK